MDYLEGLNSEQRAAVTHREGPMLVVAGAGTGKTQVITRRIAYLLDEGLAKPREVLALTFTERAAREMEERLYGLIGWRSFEVPVLTFNAFGSELLGRFASYIGRPTRGGLLNDSQKALLLMQHIHELPLQYFQPGNALYEFTEQVVEYIGILQNSDISSNRYLEYVQENKNVLQEIHEHEWLMHQDLSSIYQLYDRLKVDTGTYDYHDQTAIPLEVMRLRPNVRERLRRDYRFVLVDEYQDTNATQDALLRQLVGKGGNIFAVGDDDQSIYGFRGARIENILDFVDHFGVKQPVVLRQNYRSGQPILDAAYRLIQFNNPDRLEARLGIGKQLQAQTNQAVVDFCAYASAADEQRDVVRQLEQAVENGASPADLAVLAATHASLSSIAKLLQAKGLSYNLSTTVSIFDQPELLSLWYLVLWLCDRADDEAISHVLHGPLVRWPHERYRQVAQLAQQSSLEAAMRVSEDPDVQGFIDQLDKWREWAREVTASHLVYRLVFEGGLAELWREAAETSPRMLRVFEDLQRWFDHMRDFETVSADGSIERYISLHPRPPKLEVQEPVGDADGVALLTVHASKGLEFERVWLVGCTQRNWGAGARSSGIEPPLGLLGEQTSRNEQELRRLFYVAITRAKQNIVVSAATKTSNGARQAMTPFVSEALGPHVVDQVPSDINAQSSKNSLLKLQQFYPLSDHAQDRLPFERADGWIELGVTALSLYDYCPYEFFVQHGLRIAQPVGPQLSFGTVLHRLFEQYYSDKLQGETRDDHAYEALLEEWWVSAGYERPEFADQDRRLAEQTLRQFLIRERMAARQPIGVEVPIRFELPESKLRLKGKIDAIFQSESGVSLRDYKTGRGRTNAEKLAQAAKTNFQLRTYALAYEELGMGQVQEVVLDYVVTGVEGAANYSPTIMKNHLKKLEQLAQAIRDRRFAPASSAGHICSAIKYYGTGEQDALSVELLTPDEIG